MKKDISVGIALKRTSKVITNHDTIIIIDNKITTITEITMIRVNITITKKTHGKIGTMTAKLMEEDSVKHTKDLNVSIAE